MSNENVAVIRCHVKQFNVLRDILQSIEDASRMNAIAVDSIDVTEDNAVIVGNNVTSMAFNLTVLGYGLYHGPAKTHLFIEIKEKK